MVGGEGEEDEAVDSGYPGDGEDGYRDVWEGKSEEGRPTKKTRPTIHWQVQGRRPLLLVRCMHHRHPHQKQRPRIPTKSPLADHPRLPATALTASATTETRPLNFSRRLDGRLRTN